MAAESLYKSRRNVDGGGSAPRPVVWVGSLNSQNAAITESDLRDEFSKVGRVERCKIMLDDSGASRCVFEGFNGQF